MKKYLLRLAVLTVCHPLLTTAVAADELSIARDQEYTLPAGKTFIHYDKLTLESNASLVIPESTRSLTLRADYFVAEKGAKIFQFFARRAPQGAQGPQGAQPDYGDTGHAGGDGQTGTQGQDSVDLTLQLGIARLDTTTILLRSQAGGHGGKGGKGGGASCGQNKRGGNGGQGGRGGTGGAPGAAGPLSLIWWPVEHPVPHYRSGQPVGLTVVLQTGEGGWGGSPGDGGDGHGGKACFPVGKKGGGSPGPHGTHGQAYTGDSVYQGVSFERRELAL